MLCQIFMHLEQENKIQCLLQTNTISLTKNLTVPKQFFYGVIKFFRLFKNQILTFRLIFRFCSNWQCWEKLPLGQYSMFNFHILEVLSNVCLLTIPSRPCSYTHTHTFTQMVLLKKIYTGSGVPVEVHLTTMHIPVCILAHTHRQARTQPPRAAYTMRRTVDSFHPIHSQVLLPPAHKQSAKRQSLVKDGVQKCIFAHYAHACACQDHVTRCNGSEMLDNQPSESSEQ